MPIVELLVPVGNELALYAAVQNGADAVYLAGKKYGARAFAGNFTDEQMISAINYCHYHEVKVYVTMNTVCFPSEIEAAFLYAQFLCEHNVDALIIQDFGLLEVLRKRLPNLVLHASTQMHLHNINALKIIKDIGVERAVISRETPLDLVREMAKLDIEIEVFVFGALCVCYSGQCYMSAINGNRSGNRGECAQPCRLKYQFYRGNEKIALPNDYLLSPRDLNTIERISELIETGVTSFKIEGRMKRPEYVAQITSEYRKAIDSYKNGRQFTPNVKELKKLHNREFTTGYLFNQKGHEIINSFRPNHIGIPLGKVIGYGNNQVQIKLTENIFQHDGLRILDTSDYGLVANKIYKNGLLVNKAQKGDTIAFDFDGRVKIGADVVLTSDSNQLSRLQNSYLSPKRLTKVNSEFHARIGQPLKLICTLNTYQVEVVSNEVVQSAERQPVSKERIIEQLSKVNELPFVLSPLELFVDNNIFISIKSVNELRRQAISKLKERINKTMLNLPSDYEFISSETDVSPTVSVIVSNQEQYDAAKMFGFGLYTDNATLYYSLSEQNTGIGFVKPRVNEDEERIVADKEYICELGQLHSNICNDIATNHYFNVTNAYAVKFLQQFGVNRICLSTELDFEKTVELINQYSSIYKSVAPVEIFLYGYRDAMITKLNIPKLYDETAKGDFYFLKQNNKKYSLLLDRQQNTRILEPAPYNIIAKMNEYKEKGVFHFLISFTIENKHEVKQILAQINWHN